MSRWRKALLVIGLGLAVSPFFLWMILRVGLATPLVNFFLDKKLAPVTTASVRVGRVRSDLFTFVEVEDILVISRSHAAAVPLLTLRSARVEFDIWNAWRGRVDWVDALGLLRVQGLNVFLLRDKAGGWNIAELFKSPLKKKGSKRAPSSPLLLPPARIEIEDSQVVLNDDARGFHSTISHLQGGLDTRALPLVVFNLAGRTEGHVRDNLSAAGQWDLAQEALFARLDLRGVQLESYVNYLLPGGDLRFEGGRAGLSLRLEKKGDIWDVGGRADIESGNLRIPAVSEPLSQLSGRVIFSPQGLRFIKTHCFFLGSQWTAEGNLHDYFKPQLELRVGNPRFALQELSRQVKHLEPLRLSGVASVSVSVTGSVSTPLVEGEIQAPALGLAGLVLDDVRAHARLDKDGLQVSGLRSGLWRGAITGEAALAFAKKDSPSSLKLKVEATGLALQESQMDGMRLLPLSGTAAATLEAEGPLSALRMDAKGDAKNVRMGSVILGDLAWNAQLRPGRLEGQVDGLKGQLSAKLGLDLGEEPQWKGTQISIDGMDVAAWALALASAPPCRLLPDRMRPASIWIRDHLRGYTDLRFALSGPLKEPTVEAYIQSFKGDLRDLHGALALDNAKESLELFVSGPLRFNEGELEAGEGKESLSTRLQWHGRGIEINALGHFPLPSRMKARPGDLRLRASADLRTLEVFRFFRKVSGRLDAELRLADYFDAPKATGYLRIKGMDAQLDRWLPELKSVKADIALNDHILEVRSLEGRAGGAFNAKGTLDFGGGRWPQGLLAFNTDERGLRVDRWDPGRGYLVLQDLGVAFQGDNAPILVKGRVQLRDAYITYGGPADEGKASASANESDGNAAQRGRAWPGIALDLRAAVGPNVWYEKSFDKAVELTLDPAKLLSSAANSAVESMLRPSLRVRLRPTEVDFMIQGVAPAITLRGDLVVDRGEFIALGNEFSIKQDPSLAMISFPGLRRGGNLQAHATTRARVTRDDPLTGRPKSTAYTIHIQVQPVPEEELLNSGLKDAFLNYRITQFSSEPEIVANNPKLQEQAVLNLLLLGDPLLDEAALGSRPASDTKVVTPKEDDAGSRVGMSQINRLLQGELRKQVARFLKAGVRLAGTNFVDVFRVVPRFKYQQGVRQTGPADKKTVSATEASKQAQESSLVFSDLTVELGKTVYDNLYASLQWIRFGADGLASEAQRQAAAGRITRDQGVRVGLEYQIAPTRTAELFYNYSVDDNLEPVSFAGDDLSQAHSAVFRIRNTLSSDNYGAATARARRYDRGAAGARSALESR